MNAVQIGKTLITHAAVTHGFQLNKMITSSLANVHLAGGREKLAERGERKKEKARIFGVSNRRSRKSARYINIEEYDRE